MMNINVFKYLPRPSFPKLPFFKKKARPKTVFIVEDNNAYARTLEAYLKKSFADIHQVRIFPVGEAAMMELSSNPSIIIMDHYLNTRYEDAVTGLDAIKEIKARKPKIPILLLSAQEDISVAVEATQKYNCRYIRKNDTAFHRVEEYLREIWR